jgi:endoglucanase
MRGSMARLAAITMAVAALCAAPASARVLQPAELPHAVAGSAYVRVNQVGYSTSAAKRAYLMSSTSEAGATFSVMDGSTAVFTARIGPQLGSWSANFPHVYALDFPTTAAGTYTITVSGPVAARSRGFAIGAGSAVYAGAIGNALSFYQDERDGPDYIPSPLRTAPAHLNDEHAMTYLTPRVDADGIFQGSLTPLGTRINAAGGWWDAGDYLKFVQTESYTTGVLLSGLRDFPAQMGPHSGADFTAETKFGVRWLLRMWNDRTNTLYYQVGVGEANDQTTGDHDIWRLPQADDTWGGHSKADRYIRHRPVFRAGKPGSPISPNLAGRDAAAFAECYQVFKSTDPKLAARCLRAAEDIFALADTSPRGHLLTVIPFDFYPESEWRDDLEWGATELYLATKGGHLPPGLPHTRARFYLRQAAHWAHAYITGPNDAADTLNLYDVSGLAHYDLYRAISMAGGSAGLAVTQAALLADLRRQLDRAIAQGHKDPFRFGFPWAAFDTTSHGFGLSVMASEYDQLTGTKLYSKQASHWLGNVLGGNAWGVSLVVGDGTRFPRCMQHQVANLAGSLNGAPPVLAGAAVEGPNVVTSSGKVDGMRDCPVHRVDPFKKFNNAAKFRDNVQSWSTVEPAIDLTATSPLAFARAAAGLN